MTKLIDLTIDMSALFVRDVGDADDAANKYNDLLLSLHEITSLDWVDACASDDMDDYIDAINEKIHQTFGKLNVRNEDFIANSEMIIKSVIDLLDMLPPFYCFHDILTDARSVSTNPDVFVSAINESHKSKMKECVASIAVLNEIYGDDVPKNIMLLSCASAAVLEVASEIVFVSSDTHDTSSVSQPGEVKSVVQVCDDEVGFMKHIGHIDAERILLSANTVEDIQLAVRVALFKRDTKMKNIDDWNSIPVPNIGARFPPECSRVLKSDKEACGKLLEALVEVACGKVTGSYPIRDVKPVGDLQPQRKRIGTSHRLNFWLGPGKAIEVAWFSKKLKSETTPYIPNPTVLK